jgi:hypothetical protein
VVTSPGNPNTWPNFPTANASYIPIGLVDCYSSSSVNQALIRQFLDYDVLLSGGPSTPTSGSGNWDYRGLWSATPVTPYNFGDVVQFISGTNSGVYYSTINSNGNSPASGLGWVQISSAYGNFL